MKRVELIRAGMLPLLLWAVIPAYGQRDRQEREDKPQKAKREEARPARPPREPSDRNPQEQPRQRQEDARRAQADRQRDQQQQAARQRDQRHERRAQRPPRPEPRGPVAERRGIWQGHRALDWRVEHRSWQQRGGYQGYRIPEDRYRSHFGPSRVFRIYSQPLIVFEGHPRFQFGGFWFSVLDPWPEYWSDTWYDDDDVYIDYAGDGYYLYNHQHPMDRIAVSVSIRMN
ncbi:hypothetical protein GETHPA_18970 [Geothrix rubra]|uniref:Uncharacterized protein n=1 Tax=Geothrix rubra TaxID=2927977 RepID=A0ABQ5Q7R3_9BACT|nr:hypothetical protein [Geothrix rubra]GLH70364.1 hypothetical protein GETHPA_18970 [Geothrix rubra]